MADSSVVLSVVRLTTVLFLYGQAWVMNSVESATLARPHGPHRSQHWTLSGAMARECGAQAGA